MIYKRKLRKMKYILIIALSIAFICIIISLVWLGNFIKKENNLVLFNSENESQEIYILGTIHEYHFYKTLGYSIANIQNVIDTIAPDIILVECRQESMDKYNTNDGPIEMMFVWSYAKETGIEVKGVDWYELSEERRSNTTDDIRDDHIFDNIIETIDGQNKVLIICGARHRIEQSKRFEKNGYIELTLNDKSTYFHNKSNENFTYPKTMSAEVEKQIEFWVTIAKDETRELTTENSDGRNYWLSYLGEVSKKTKKILDELILHNKLYW